MAYFKEGFTSQERTKINTENIIERDYSDLTNKEGFTLFISIFDPLLSGGGVIAGGFPRRVLKHNSFTKALESCLKQADTAKQTDIDVYFTTSEDFEKASTWCLEEASKNLPLAEKMALRSKHANPTTYHKNYLGYTYFISGYCVNLIQGGEAKKTPQEIIAEFDIINCSLGFTDEQFFFDKRIPELEAKNVIGLNEEYISGLVERKSYSQRFKLLERIGRYLDMPEYKNGLDHLLTFRKLLGINRGFHNTEYVSASLVSKLKEEELPLICTINSYIDSLVNIRVNHKEVFDKVVELDEKIKYQFGRLPSELPTPAERTYIARFYQSLDNKYSINKDFDMFSIPRSF